MSDYFELTAELNDSMQQAWRDLDESKQTGIRASEARAAYRAAMSAEILDLRANSKLPASLIPKVAEGSERVNELALQYDISEVLYKAACEAVQLRKRQVDIIREQIGREDRNPRRENL